MNIITKIRLAAAANGLVNAIGKIPMPQGQALTWLGAVTLLVIQWLTASGDLLGPKAAPYVSIAICILSGIHAISALDFSAPSGIWTVSAVKAVILQVVVIIGQTCNQLLPIVPPEWQEYLTDILQVVQMSNSISWLNKSKS